MCSKKIKKIINSYLLVGLSCTLLINPAIQTTAYATERNKTSITVNTDSLSYNEKSGIYNLKGKTTEIKGKFAGDTSSITSFTYTIKDEKGITVKEGEVSNKDNWTIKDAGFMLGKNTLTLTAETTSGKVEQTFNIYNENIDNSKNVDVDENDSDNDGLLNYWEDYFGTDKYKSDTDNDGVSDKDEIFILGTDPLKADTNNNGVLDGDEDFDEDSLTNKEEISRGTNPYLVDTDGDSLSDADEINKYSTEPLNKDTNNDGVNDGFEVNLNQKSRAKGSGFTMEVTANDDKAKLYSDSLTGRQLDKFKLETATEAHLSTIPGIKSAAYKLGCNSNCDISIEYTPISSSEKPVIYKYNVKTQRLKKITTTYEDGYVKAHLNGKTKELYLILDEVEYEANKNNSKNDTTEKIDSNNDGISDADTLKMCNGELLTATNSKVFKDATYEEVQANDDYDKDGIKNGDEITIEKDEDGINYVYLKSSPASYDTDDDGINDLKDTAPLERGLKDGVIGYVQLYSRHDPNESFILGHAFLVFTSYVNNETIAIKDLNRAYTHNKENNTYTLREDNDDSYTMQRGDYVSIGNFRTSGLDVMYDSVTGDYKQIWTDSGLSNYLDKDNLTLSDIIKFSSNGDSSTVVGDNITSMSGGSIRFNEEIYDTQAYENFIQYPNYVLTKDITQDELDKLLEYDNNHNYYQLFSNNCSSIAVGAWNEAFSDKLSAREESGLYSIFDTPMILKSNISKRDGAEKDVKNFGVSVE